MSFDTSPRVMANHELQINALTRHLWRLLHKTPPGVTVEQLETLASEAAAAMTERTEVIRVGFEGGGTDATLAYPAEVVLTAVNDVLDAIAAETAGDGVRNRNETFVDFSLERIES